jgi:hypothetical protein
VQTREELEQQVVERERLEKAMERAIVFAITSMNRFNLAAHVLSLARVCDRVSSFVDHVRRLVPGFCGLEEFLRLCQSTSSCVQLCVPRAKESTLQREFQVAAATLLEHAPCALVDHHAREIRGDVVRPDFVMAPRVYLDDFSPGVAPGERAVAWSAVACAVELKKESIAQEDFGQLVGYMLKMTTDPAFGILYSPTHAKVVCWSKFPRGARPGVRGAAVILEFDPSR